MLQFCVGRWRDWEDRPGLASFVLRQCFIAQFLFNQCGQMSNVQVPRARIPGIAHTTWEVVQTRRELSQSHRHEAQAALIASACLKDASDDVSRR